MLSRPGVSPKPGAGRSGPVVIVTAGIPRAMKGACSYTLNGKPRSTSWRSVLTRDGSPPVSAASSARTVSTRLADGERAVSPASSSRGRPAPATPSRLTTAITFCRSGECAANSAAPSPPTTAASVERKMSE